MDEYRDHVIYPFTPYAYRRRRQRCIRTIALSTIAFLALLVWALIAHAQQQKADPLQTLSADWQAMASLQIHVQDDLNALAQAYQASQKAATEADDRLKWVLDTWVPKVGSQAKK